LVGLRPALHDHPRRGRRRPDARDHAGRHRPVDAGRDLVRRQPARRRQRRTRRPAGARASRLPRARGRGRAAERAPRRNRGAEPPDRHAGGRPGRVRLEPEVRTRGHELDRCSERALLVGGGEAARSQLRVLDGRRADAGGGPAPALHRGGSSLSGGGGEPESGMDGRPPHQDARRLRVHGGRHPLRQRGDPARRHPHQRRPRLRRRLPAVADRRRRHRGRLARGWAGELDLHVGGSAGAHLLDADAPDPGPPARNAVHRLRRGDHRRDADLRRLNRLAARAHPEAGRGAVEHQTEHGRKHELRLAKGGTMHGGKRSSTRGRRRFAVLLAVAVGVGALAIASPGSGAGPVVVGTGGGFGEVYQAKASTLKHTLFDASLLPKNPTSRKIALAALGRAEKKVNYALALKCWKNNVCNTGTGGKLTVAYIEQFGENVFRQMSHMEFILQALTYPQVGRIIYKSAHSDLNQGIADFKAAIAQKVSLIVTYPDFGDAMLPVMKE